MCVGGEGSALWRPIGGRPLSDVESELSLDMFVMKCGCQTQGGRKRGGHQPLPCQSPAAPITHRATAQHYNLLPHFRPLQFTTLAWALPLPLGPLLSCPLRLGHLSFMRPQGYAPQTSSSAPASGSLSDLACRGLSLPRMTTFDIDHEPVECRALSPRS